VVHKYSQQVRSVTPATLIGRGKVDEIYAGLQEHHANLVIVDEDLTPAQQRNLENAFKVRVVDRSQLISISSPSGRTATKASCRSSWRSWNT
jgi:GTP-binding protein HflX